MKHPEYYDHVLGQEAEFPSISFTSPVLLALLLHCIHDMGATWLFQFQSTIACWDQIFYGYFFIIIVMVIF